MRFEHDCDECVPLGEEGDYDLYYCPQHGMPTMVARYGSHCWEYKCGMALVGVDAELTRAFELAKERGLVEATAADASRSPA